ncbi:MAG: efflux RND transporter periplasmic adaptor subunit [Peptococcaceae bacterium]|nr:efflux RND transporter periplasmic adaptor subunit [Peptococcaceae bacterium]
MDLKNELTEAGEKRRRWIRPVAVAAILVLVLLLIVSRLNSRKAESPATGEMPQPVEVASVMSRPIGEELSVAGTVTPFAEARLSPKIMGRVASVNADVGRRVKQGETLLTIEQSDYLSALKQAEASLAMAEANSIQAETGYENARLNYQRFEELFRQGAVSQSQLEEARGKLAAAESACKANRAQVLQCQAMLEKARSDYSHTEVKAPFAGVVAQRFVDIGEMVSQQTPVFTVIQDDPLLVRVNLPENVVSRVSPDQQVDIFVAATGKTYKGAVKSVAPQADSQTKAFAAEIKLAGVSQEVKPGMVAELRITTKQVDSALVVPTDALLDEDGGAGIFVVENGIARHRKVTTGLEGHGYTQVVSGLQQGELVVVKGNHLLVDGMKVRVEGSGKGNPPGTGGEPR